MSKETKLIAFGNLKLDLDNKRYNKIAGPFKTEAEVIDYMLDFENLEDLIKSIQSKGYENDEAVWVIADGSDFVVKEGNRRLSALKVLANPKAYEDKIKGVKGIKVPEVLCSIYADKNILDARIIARHTQDSIRGWNRLAQAFEIQEEFERLKNWDKIEGNNKKDLYKVANFYEVAHKILPDISRTFIKDSDGDSKFEVWTRLLGFGLPKKHFGFDVDSEFKIKINDKSLFKKFVETAAGLLLSNKIKSADVVKDNLQNLLETHFKDFLIPEPASSTKTNGDKEEKPEISKKTADEKPDEKKKERGSVKKKPTPTRKNIPAKLDALIKECYGLTCDKYPNAKIAMTRVLFEGALKFVVENTKFDKKTKMKNSNWFRLAFFDKKGNKKKYTDFDHLQTRFAELITITRTQQAFKNFDLEGTHSVIHNYDVIKTSNESLQYCNKLIPIIDFLLQAEDDLLSELDISKL
jgi:hypothetical protein